MKVVPELKAITLQIDGVSREETNTVDEKFSVGNALKTMQEIKWKLKFKNLLLIIVFRRKLLCGGRQGSYIHAKILTIVCPNRTCIFFKIGQQIKFKDVRCQ